MKRPDRLTDGTKVYWPDLPLRTKISRVLEGIGELLLTGGVILGLFVGYKAIWQDTVVADQQTVLAQTYEEAPSKFLSVKDVSKLGDVFGQMYVPRFGDTWTRLIGEGTRWHPTLNEIGVGHYTGTAMPGEVGNFAVAAHRGGFGGAFKEIHTLREGDRVYVKTKDFWYVYKYLQTKVVQPDDIDVISEVPWGLAAAEFGGSYMTMTSCTPIFVNTERIVVWLELENATSVTPAEMAIHGGN